MVYIAICHFELLHFVDEKRHFLIFTSEGFDVSTFRQSQPLVGQDALIMLYGLPCMSLNQVFLSKLYQIYSYCLVPKYLSRDLTYT